MLMGATIDITTRKRAEEERLQRAQQIERLSRLAIMSELAATVAHELNQPLGAILCNAQSAEKLLNRTTPDLTEAREALSDILADSQRAAARLCARNGFRRLETAPGEDFGRLTTSPSRSSWPIASRTTAESVRSIVRVGRPPSRRVRSLTARPIER